MVVARKEAVSFLKDMYQRNTPKGSPEFDESLVRVEKTYDYYKAYYDDGNGIVLGFEKYY